MRTQIKHLFSYSLTHIAATISRAVFLVVLAGHLLFRREFAHRNLGELFPAAHSGPLGCLYVTELALLIMLPAVLMIIYQRRYQSRPMPPGQECLAFGLGPGFYLGLAFLGWGLIHLLCAFVRPHESAYLIFRQSVLCGYSVLFLCAFVLFGDRERYVLIAVLAALLVSVECAAADALGFLKPAFDPSSLYPGEPVFGQQTLPIAILGLSLFIVYTNSLPWRIVSFVVLAFVFWREGSRELQSVVPVSLAGAVLLYLIAGVVLAWKGQSATFKRAFCLLLFFGVLALGAKVLKKSSAQSAEVGAWSPTLYRDLMDIYNKTSAPQNPAERVVSARDPGVIVDDPEVYKLNAVYARARPISSSVVNNIWRLILWRRMLEDWRKAPILGAGVGNAWNYNKVLFQTPFHYEPDAGGLNPHNSYVNLFYRYGLVGLILLLALLLSVIWNAGKALKFSASGDVMLEGIMLYFFYTFIFAAFTVTLEGPSYSFPYWTALGLVYGRARQILCIRAQGLAS